MTRLTDLHGALAGSTEVRWDPRSADVDSVVLTARTLRSEFIADHLHSGFTGIARWTGLAALFVGLRRRLERRRTLRQLARLDDRMLSDIGVQRADIEATAAMCTKTPAADTALWRDSVWYKTFAWLGRERRRRQTIRELSAMSDEILADVGIERAEIPAVAAALTVGTQDAAPGGAPIGAVTDIPVTTAPVLAFMAVRRSVQRAANQNRSRPTAA